MKRETTKRECNKSQDKTSDAHKLLTDAQPDPGGGWSFLGGSPQFV